MTPNRTLLFALALSLLLHLAIVLAFFAARSKAEAPMSIGVEVQRAALSQNLEKPKQPQSLPTQTSESTTDISPTDGTSTGPLLGSAIGLNAQYPRLSRVTGEDGRVVIDCVQDLQTHALSTRVISSTGHARLDQAALQAVDDGFKRGLLGPYLKDGAHFAIAFVFELTPAAK